MGIILTIGSFIFGLFGKKNATAGESQGLGIATVIGGVLVIGLVIALLITRSTLAGRTAELEAANAYKASVLTATRDAANNPRLIERDVPAQIVILGDDITVLTAGLLRCNATSRAAADNDARRQREADERIRAAEAHAAAGQALIDRLRASAATARPGAAACVPSATVREIWP